MKRTILSAILIAGFCLSGNVFAVLSGGGTETNPYLIQSRADFDEFANPANAATYWSSGVYTKLMCDLNLSGTTYTQAVIAPDTNSGSSGFQGTQFTGIFDGNGHAISNLTIAASGKDYIGLFGYIGTGGQIQNLGIETVNLTGRSNVGGLAGEQVFGIIMNCYSTGSVTSSSTSSSIGSAAGGLVGCNYYASITCSYSTCLVTSSSSSASSAAGGLVGNNCYASITFCYSTGSVASSSSLDMYSYAGGLVGDGGGYTDSIITHSYSTGGVSTSGSGYKLKGGLVGSGGTVINSFWNKETSGLNYSAGGTGRTTAQLKQSANYIGWNTPAQIYWTINEGVDYPRLSWQSQPGTPLGAQTISDYIPGAGTISEPYRISTPQQLNSIGLFPDAWDKTFRLENNIDCSSFSGAEYNRIGLRDKPFSGSFQGGGYSIQNLTYTTTGAVNYLGFFGYAKNAVIRDLVLENVNLSTAGDWVGGLVASQVSGAIMNCRVTGSIASSSANSARAGGLVGLSSGTISNCSSAGSVTTVSSAINWNSVAGGLVGIQSSGTIADCYSTSSVSSSSDWISWSLAGGLVGSQESGAIMDCYSAGSASASNSHDASTFAGGLVGYSTGSITNCYSTGPSVASNSGSGSTSASAGGLVGASTSDIINCYSTGTVAGNKILGGLVGSGGNVVNSFWDKDTSAQTISSGGTGKTTAEMKTLTTFTVSGWDFTNETSNGINDFWRMCVDGIDYPRLSWERGRVGDFTCPDGAGLDDLQELATAWLSGGGLTEYSDACDTNADGTINLPDYAVLAEYWLKTYYILSTSVAGGNGTVAPASQLYLEDTVVGLTATPDSNYQVNAWTGTDHDTSKKTTNTVTMTSNKNVAVQFEYTLMPNGGFEMGDFTYWTPGGDVTIDVRLTEGDYSAFLSDGGGTLTRTVNLPGYGDYTVSFDYLCFSGPAVASVEINGLSYSLTADDAMHTFTLDLLNVDSFTIEFSTPGGSPLVVDNCAVVVCFDCQPVCNYNGYCDSWEDPMICPDCQMSCNYNGYCDSWEDPFTCPDCGGGMCDYNGWCDPWEDPFTCPDCGGGMCDYNGWCDPWEDPFTCPDCGGGPICGDGWCDPGEEGWCPDCPF